MWLKHHIFQKCWQIYVIEMKVPIFSVLHLIYCLTLYQFNLQFQHTLITYMILSVSTVKTSKPYNNHFTIN